MEKMKLILMVSFHVRRREKNSIGRAINLNRGLTASPDYKVNAVHH